MTFPTGSPGLGTPATSAFAGRVADNLDYLQDALEGAPTAWTPTWTATTTNPTPGTGTGAGTSGWWKQHGSIVTASFYLGFGTAGVAAGSGFYQMSLPVPALATTYPYGSGHIFDFSATGFAVCSVVGISTTTARFGVSAGYVTQAVPIAFATGDKITGVLKYQAA